MRPQLPPGLVESDRLSEPVVTPATKAVEGHDLNITETEAEAVCGAEAYASARAAALALYSFAAGHAEECGILLADTKFELGIDTDGTVTLADEALTPDSSRFWPADAYAARDATAVLRQAVRAGLLPLDGGGTAPPPGPSCPRTSWPARALATWRHSSV